MKQHIELSKVREFGDILSDTFLFVRQNFKPLLKTYFVICGLFLVTAMLVSILASGQSAYDGGNSPFSFTKVLGMLFDLVNYTALMLTTLSYLALYKAKENQPPGVVEVWSYFKYYFFRVLIVQVILGIGLTIGFFMCFIPCIYLLTVFSLVTPIMIIENGNTEYSIKRAFKIIKNNWWLTFGVILLMSIIVLMVMLIFMVPAIFIFGSGQWLTGKSFSSGYTIALSIIIHLWQVLGILPIIAVTLVYYTLTEQKEAGGLINRIKTFGKNNTNDQFPSEQY
ncbi:MAG: hypothetical protein JWR38_3576 [Mucilaginibacter sp.]|nr:hypothetical protein [Mucilaginibacter sp.]